MRLARIRTTDGTPHVAIVHDQSVQPLDLSQVDACDTLSDILHASDPAGLAKFLLRPDTAEIAIDDITFLAPIDRQEVWAAGSDLQAQPGCSNGRIRSRRVTL